MTGLPSSAFFLVKEKEAAIHCYRRERFTDEEVLAGIAAHRSGKAATKTFGELTIEGEDSALLSVFEVLLRTKTGELAPSALAKLAKVRNSFAPMNVLDASRAVFGEEIGPRLVYLALHYHVNASHFQLAVASPWQKGELDTVLLGLSDLPPHLVPLPQKYPDTPYQTLVHYTRGSIAKREEMTLADAHVYLYDLWNEESALSQRITIFHEVSHNFQNLISQEKNWASFSTWITEKNYSEALSANAFVSEYAMTNRYEDFAESSVTYRYRPDWLKKRSPRKYEYLRDVLYSGVEYDTESACQEPETNSKLWAEQAKAKVVDYVARLRSTGDYSLPDSASRRKNCDTAFLLGRVNTPKKANATHEKCLANLHLQELGKTGAVDHPYAEDITDVLWRLPRQERILPGFEAETIAEMGRFQRAKIYEAILADYRKISGSLAESSGDARTPASSFIQRALRDRNSAIAKLGFVTGDRLGLEILLARAYQAALDSRPNYLQVWEDFAGYARATPEELSPALEKALAVRP
jgi:hypothetical protein